MHPYHRRAWVPAAIEDFIAARNHEFSRLNAVALIERIEPLGRDNQAIHTRECFNLNPATNLMNPRAEQMLASGIGPRPSLGYPGDKYEMGLEAIEQIEIVAAQLACTLFAADYAEIRVGSGALANLYAFMATCQPGDRIIVPPASIGGHVTHNRAGAAGLYGLEIHEAPVDASRYTLDLGGLRAQARELKPRLITVGSSLNLLSHNVAAIREIADEVGAKVLFDAAHQCGMIAGKIWPSPLAEGAHLMTMSTYKSLGGPPAGLIVSNDAELMQRIDQIAFPGLTANFDAAKSAALAITLVDWLDFGQAYAQTMQETSIALAEELAARDMPVFSTAEGFTQSHQFALEAAPFGGGQTAAKRLRQAHILTSGIGLPMVEVENDMNGLRLGTPEVVRIGMQTKHMPPLAGFIAAALSEGADLGRLAAAVSEYRQGFQQLHFMHDGPVS
ncbi:MAG: aminotransferase class I/II-fold pyridoxal phosphate-dependent enzyme [Thiolinea sp.]